MGVALDSQIWIIAIEIGFLFVKQEGIFRCVGVSVEEAVAIAGQGEGQWGALLVVLGDPYLPLVRVQGGSNWIERAEVGG